MPFYNGAETVIRALESIHQMPLALDEYEVIVVDDCSPVPAIDALGDYRKTHPTIRIIRHDKNMRQGGAKNTGMKVAKGRYIALVDQDDMIVPDNMYRAIQKAIKTGADVVSCHYLVQETDSSRREVGVCCPDKDIVSGKEYCENYYDPHDSIGPWSYLYKTNYVHRLNRPMKEHVLLEDPDWTIWHLIHADKMAFLPLPIYVWVMNPTSITHSTEHYTNRVDWIKAGLRKIEDAEKYRYVSAIFADKITIDGRWNVDDGFRKLWKVDNYYKFYTYLYESLSQLRASQWQGKTDFYINHPTLSMCLLYLIGTPIKWIYYARNYFVS